MRQSKYSECIFYITRKLKQRITGTLNLERKIFIFKALGISKIVYLSLIITNPNSILEEIQNIQKTFLWCSSKPKMNPKTVCNTFEDGGLKYVDVK